MDEDKILDNYENVMKKESIQKDEYPIPEELDEIEIKAEAAKQLLLLYTQRPFGFKKAKICSIEHQKYIRQFWRKVYELYPELQKYNTSYYRTQKIVKLIKT